jgi:hypothetical protein
MHYYYGVEICKSSLSNNFNSLSPEGFETWPLETEVLAFRLPANKDLGLKFKTWMTSALLHARRGDL